MSSCVVFVTRVNEVLPHIGADRLEIVKVGGWQVIVQKGSFKPGDVAVYFPPDTAIPVGLAERITNPSYLKAAHCDGFLRVGKTKLRGENSFGLLVPTSALEMQDRNVGDIVTKDVGAIKYEHPLTIQDGNVIYSSNTFCKYTDVEDLRNFPDMLEGYDVVIHEKIHGTNSRVGIDGEDFVCGSKVLQRKIVTDSVFSLPLWDDNVLELLVGVKQNFKASSVGLYGEIFGQRMRGNFNYGVRPGYDYRAFDIVVEGQFLHHEVFEELCAAYEVETAPLLYNGIFNMDMVRDLAKGPSLVGGSHSREGVVVKSAYELTSPKYGRLIGKFVSDDWLFDLGHDTTDV